MPGRTAHRRPSRTAGDQAERRAARLAALHEVARDLAASQTDADVIATLAARMEALCGGRIWVALYEADTDTLDMRFWLMDGQRVPEWEVPKSGATGLGGEVARMGVTIATSDYVGECQLRGLLPDGPAPAGTRVNMPWVGVPLAGRQGVLGVLCAFKRQGEPFDHGLIEVLETLAAHGSTALENIRLRAAEVARRAELEARASELARSEAELRSLIDAMACGVMVVAADGQLERLNPAGARILGRGQASFPAEPVGATLQAVRPDGSPLPAAAGPIGQAVRRARAVRDQLVGITRADGQRRWLQVDAVPVAGPDGAVARVVCSFLDLTDRQMVEEALQESEQRYRRLVELSPDAIVVHVDGQVVYANRAAGLLFGAASPEQLHGMRVLDLVHPDSRADVLRRVGELHAGAGEVPPAEERLVRLDGRPIDAEIAAAAVVYRGRQAVQVVARDVSERKRNRELLEYQALHDGLTGLPNRRQFADRLQRALTPGGARPGWSGVMFVDLDDFKVINDTLSHQHGDRVLHEIARRLQRCVRSGDTVARLGGDEFAILFHHVRSAAAVLRTAGRIQRAVGRPIRLGARSLAIHASIGIALTDRATDPDVLLRNADFAMYEAKAAGKGQAVVFDATLEARVFERLELERELGGALDRGELRLHYQPLFDLATGRLTGAEALLRWQHPRRGLVPPDRFIALAESSGLIVPIGRWVLQEACRQTGAWLDAGVVDHDFELAVNLSARQLQRPDLASDVADALARAALRPRQLVLEVTESTAMADVHASLEALRSLKALGVGLAIDDFGTGYSSLSHLKQFPINVLKIDRSFVRGVATDRQDQAIVRTVVALARALGLSVTAEGIETTGQHRFLRTVGCDRGQGYLLGRPAPPQALGTQHLDAA